MKQLTFLFLLLMCATGYAAEYKLLSTAVDHIIIEDQEVNEVQFKAGDILYYAIMSLVASSINGPRVQEKIVQWHKENPKAFGTKQSNTIFLSSDDKKVLRAHMPHGLLWEDGTIVDRLCVTRDKEVALNCCYGSDYEGRMRNIQRLIYILGILRNQIDIKGQFTDQQTQDLAHFFIERDRCVQHKNR